MVRFLGLVIIIKVYNQILQKSKMSKKPETVMINTLGGGGDNGIVRAETGGGGLGNIKELKQGYANL